MNIIAALEKTDFRKTPWVTVFLMASSIVLFIGIKLESGLDSWDVHKKWGAPSADDIWNGALWGLFTSNFLHVEFWHLVFNLSWMWFLGKKIEWESRVVKYLLITLSAAFITSIYQLAFSETTGIGLSGIIYAYFGFIFIMARYDRSYQGYLTRKTTIIFLAWLVLCVVLTYAGGVNIGNAGHISGLMWGAMAGFTMSGQIRFRYLIPAAVMIISFVSVFWAPWSSGWLSNKALMNTKKATM
jgi:membrane associated rhomboid family serine protease